MSQARGTVVGNDGIQCPVALECGNVSQHHSSADISDCEDGRYIGPHVRVCDNALRRPLQTCGVKIHRLDIRSAAHGHKHLVSLHLVLLVLLQILDFQHITIFLDALHGGSGLDGNTPLAKCLLEPLGKVGVETRENILAVLHH